MIELAAFVVTFLGLSCFALSMDAHWKQLRGGTPAKVPLRIAGTVALLGSFALLRIAESPTLAPLTWTMMLTVAALVLALALSRKPS